MVLHAKQTSLAIRAWPLIAVLLLALQTGCAGQPQPDNTQPDKTANTTAQDNNTELEPTVVAYDDYRDPLQGMNRAVFAFNDVVYRYAMIPVAKGYNWLLPNPVKTGIGNVFHNIKMPIRSLNLSLIHI